MTTLIRCPVQLFLSADLIWPLENVPSVKVWEEILDRRENNENMKHVEMRAGIRNFTNLEIFIYKKGAEAPSEGIQIPKLHSHELE